jgi:hypothetical protein
MDRTAEAGRVLSRNRVSTSSQVQTSVLSDLRRLDPPVLSYNNLLRALRDVEYVTNTTFLAGIFFPVTQSTI